MSFGVSAYDADFHRLSLPARTFQRVPLVVSDGDTLCVLFVLLPYRSYPTVYGDVDALSVVCVVTKVVLKEVLSETGAMLFFEYTVPTVYIVAES